MTRRAHLEAAEEQTGQRLIEEPEIPAEAQHLWGWFWELDAGRGGNGFGPSPLSFSEIEAWTRLAGQRVEPWEVAAIRAMDRAALEALTKKTDAKK